MLNLIQLRMFRNYKSKKSIGSQFKVKDPFNFLMKNNFVINNDKKRNIGSEVPQKFVFFRENDFYLNYKLQIN